MPALLKNPLTVPANPVFATGARLDELTVEATRKLAYIMKNFRMCRQYVGDSGDFNRSLARLRKALAGSFDAKRDLQSVHIELRLVIQHHAEKYADGRGNFGHLSPDDLEIGARKAVETLSPYRGRTRDPSCGITSKA